MTHPDIAPTLPDRDLTHDEALDRLDLANTMVIYRDHVLGELRGTIARYEGALERRRITVASLENENHALREELNETRRDRDDLQAQLEDVRYIQRTLTPVEYQ